VERVQHHPELTRIFVANLHDNKVILAGVTIIVSPSIIVDATKIPNVGEECYKAQDLDEHYYEPTSNLGIEMKQRGFFLLGSLKTSMPL